MYSYCLEILNQSLQVVILSVSKCQLFWRGYSPKVTGIVKSSLPKDIDMIKVIAIAFDANDKIIGSGYTYVDFVPANGQSAVEMTWRLPVLLLE